MMKINTLLSKLPIIALITTLIGVIFGFSKTFDMTDEAFYLLNAEYHQDIFSSASFFGFFLKILLQLSLNNLFVFRISGVIILMGSSFFFFNQLAKFTKINFQSLFISTNLMATLSYYIIWLPTPSYNWLALISIFLVSGSLICLIQNPRMPSFCSHCLHIGLWGFICFSSKPTTALILAIFSLIASIKIKTIKFKLFFIAVSSLFALLLQAILIIYLKGTFANYFLSLQESLQLASLLNDTQSLWKQLFIFFSHLTKFPITLILSLSLIISAITFHKNNFSKKLYNVIFYLLISGICLYFFKLIFKVFSPYNLWSFWYLCSVVTLSLLVATKIKSRDKFPLTSVIIWITLLLLNLSFSFGTNTSLAKHLSFAVAFTYASCLILSHDLLPIYRRFEFKHLFTMMIILSISQLLLRGAYRPYRQKTPVLNQNTEATLLFHDMKVTVSSRRAKYIDNVKNIALKHSWQRKTLLLDMTGASPGLNLVLDATIPKAAWLIGGYKKSSQFVNSILKKNSFETLKRAWIVTSPKYRRSVPQVVLEENGIFLNKTHQRIGTVFNPYRQVDEIFWKPIL